MSAHLHAAGRPHVTAIIVAHDGEPWLPALLAALDASTSRPDLLVAVDTGSTDRSRELLTAALGERAVLAAPPETGFGAAVAAALQRWPPRHSTVNSWVWLLHDDCAPAPDALSRLLETAMKDTGIGVVGCRVRAWPRGRRLLEVGVTITGTGHRETGLELAEYDHGQHDELRDVLAVSSAGMLVRHNVWQQLGGFDPRLPLFRDDVDFGWRVTKAGARVVVAPGAVVFHAEAATRGVRRISNTSANPQRADRRAALYTVLANCSSLAWPFQYVRFFLGSLLRAFGYLLGKLPGAAWQELVAATSVLARPDRILAARSARRKQSAGDSAEVRALLPQWWTPYANGIEAVTDRFSDSFRSATSSLASSARPPNGVSPLRSVLAHPLMILIGTLTVAGLVASRGLWGDGFLQGGSLPPAPASAEEWWRLYAQTWHPVRFGSTAVASPYVAALGLAGTVLLGKAWLVVDALMLLAPVFAAAGAYVAARRLVRSQGVRLWMALAYGLLPVVTGATASGRIGTVAATILLPWLVPPVAALIQPAGGERLRPACAAGLVLALMSAFVPVAEAMAAVLLVVAAPWLLTRGAAAIPYLGLAVLSPVVLLLPWSWRFVDAPELLLTEAGLPDRGSTPSVGPGWQLAFGRLPAMGDAPWWLTAGISVAAVLALLRSHRNVGIAAAWVVIAISLGAAAVLSHFTLEHPGGFQSGSVWVGFPVIVAQAAALVAGGLAADGLTAEMRSKSFGWRQPLAATAGLAAVLTPVAGLAWWSAAAPHGDLVRSGAVPLPVYMVDEMTADRTVRVLVMRGDARRVTYDVLAGDGLRLGDDSVLAPVGSAIATGVVTDLVTQGQTVELSRLARLGVRYLVLPRPVDPRLSARLDAVPGLSQASTGTDHLAGWQLAAQSRALDKAVAPSSASGSERRGELTAQGIMWLLALVLAAPAVHRHTGPRKENR